MLQRFTVRFYYGWLIVAVLAVANFTQVGEFNPVLAVFVKPFGNDFGWSRAEVALAITLGSFAGGLVGPIFGPVIDRYGTRVVLTCCQLVYGSCLFSLTFLQGSLVQFVATYGLGRTVVQGGAALAGQAIIANWFYAKRGKAMATSTLGTLIGQSALPAMAAYITATWHWRYAWLMLGLFTLVLAAPPTALFLRRRPEDLGLLPDGATRSPVRSASAPAAEPAVPVTSNADWTPRQVVRSRSFWCLLGASSFASFTGAGINLHLYPYLTDVGLSVARAVTVASVFFGIGAVASLIWGALMDRFPLRVCLAIDFLITAVGVALLMNTTSFGTGMAFAVVYGVSFGGIHTMISVMWAVYFGRRHVGAIAGISLPAQLTVNALGPLSAAWLFDVQGNYDLAFSLFAGSALASALLTWLAGKPQPAPQRRDAVAAE